MKKNIHFLGNKAVLLLAFLSFAYVSKAQNINAIYNLNYSTGTYTPVLPTANDSLVFSGYFDDLVDNGYNLPFDFTYNGNLYPSGASISISSNGWISFNSATTSAASQYLAAVGAPNNGIAGFNVDLQSQSFTASGTPSISSGTNLLYNVGLSVVPQVGMMITGTGIPDNTFITAVSGSGTYTLTLSNNATATNSTGPFTISSSVVAVSTGSSPNRKVTVQWSGVRRYGFTGDLISFQIVLNEGPSASQTIQAIYNVQTTSGTSSNVQVGLRGNSITDVKANTSWSANTSNTTNTTTIPFSSAAKPAIGATFTWAPNCAPGTATITGITLTNFTISTLVPVTSVVSPCPSNTYPVSTTGMSTGANAPTYYVWSYSNSSAYFANPITTTPNNAITFTSTSGGVSGTITATAYNQCGAGASVTTGVIVPAAIPATSLTYDAITNLCAPSGTIQAHVTGVGGGTFGALQSGLDLNTTTGAVNLSNSQPGVYTITYSYSSGACAMSVNYNLFIPVAAAVTVKSTISSPFCTLPSPPSGQIDATPGGPVGKYSMYSIGYYKATPEGSVNILRNTSTDDTWYTNIQMNASSGPAFDFKYFGLPYSTINVNTNGYASFNAPAGTSWTAQNIPSATAPNNVVALFWSDLYLDVSLYPDAYIRTFTNGTSPNRTFVIEFNKLRFYGSTASGQEATGQIVFYEKTNIIDILVKNLDDLGRNLTKTLGIEDGAGGLALPDAANYPTWQSQYVAKSWRAQQIGFRFIPDFATYTYDWSTNPNFLSATNIANPSVTGINSTQTYTVNAVNQSTMCPVSKSITLTAINSTSITSSTNGVSCGPNKVILNAAGTGSELRWYDAPTGGTLLFTGAPNSSFTTPFLFQNTNYYVETGTSTGSGCTSGRTLVTATINPPMSPVTVSPSSVSRCFSEPANLLTASGGKSAAVSGTPLNENFETGTAPFSTFTYSGGGSLTTTTLSANGGAQSVKMGYNSYASDTYTSNNINLSGQSFVQLSFFHIAAIEGSTGTTEWDNGYIQYSSDGGATWTYFTPADYVGAGALTLAQNPAGAATFNRRSYPEWNGFTSITTTFTNAMWHQEIFNIPATALTANFKVRFRLYSDNIINLAGWMLDDIKLTTYTTTNQPLIWIPNGTTSGLYTDAAATIAYTGGNATSLYTKPNANTVYTVTANAGGCEQKTTVQVNVNNPQVAIVTNGQVCKSTSTPISVTAVVPANSTVNWYNAASGGAPITTGVSVINGISTYTSTVSLTAPNLTNTVTYYVATTTTAGSCEGSRIPVTATIKKSNTWLGASSDWADGANWCLGDGVSIYPGQSFGLALSIPANAAIMPIVGSSTIAGSGALTIENGARLTVQNGGVYYLNGSNIVLNGTLTVDGRLVFVGGTKVFPSAALTTGTLNPINELEINQTANTNTVTLNAHLNIKGSLILTKGRPTLGNYNITLKSDANRTADVRQINKDNVSINYNGTGRFIIERYISNLRKWQLLAATTQDTTGTSTLVSTTLKANWMLNEGNDVFGQSTDVGIRTLDSTANAVSNGFDALSVAPSIKYWSNNRAAQTGGAVSGEGYVGLPNANYDLSQTSTSGYFVFPLRSRKSTGNGSSTTISTKGRINNGTISSPTINSGERLIVGNPYPSAVDMRSVMFGGTGIKEFYIWDPLLANSTYQSGNYQTLTRVSNGTTDDFTITPGGGSYGSTGTMNIVQSGQAIFVKGTASQNGVVTFEELTKSSASSLVFRNGQQSRTNIKLHKQDSAQTLLDGVMVEYNNGFNKSADDKDVEKMFSGPNVYLERNGKKIAVERFGKINHKDTFNVRLAKVPAGKYYFDLNSQFVDLNGLTAYLVDNQNQTLTPIDYNSAIINFELGTDASVNSTRFQIVFAKEKKNIPVANLAKEVLLFSNPIQNNRLKFEARNFVLGNSYQATVSTLQGQVVHNFSFNATGLNTIVNQTLPQLVDGLYMLTITGANGVVITKKFNKM